MIGKRIFRFFASLICIISTSFYSICFAESLTDGFIQISAGESHCIALKSDGTVWAWGKGTEGQLGNGRFENSTIPVKVEGLSDITKISAGANHNLALNEETGEVWSWGSNSCGQLGIGNHSNKAIPQLVEYSKCSPYTLARSIDAGFQHSMVWTYDTVLTFGRNVEGQLGDYYFGDEKLRVGNVSGYSYKVEETENITNVWASGNRGYFGLKYYDADGMSYMGWGENISTEPKAILTNVGIGEYKFIVGGNNYALYNNSNIEYYENDELKSYEFDNISEICLGYDFGILKNKSGEIYNFGKDFLGTNDNSEFRKLNVNINNIKSISAGKDFVMFLDYDGNVWGLGLNNYGQLGNGNTKNASEPVKIKSLDFAFNGTAVAVARGKSHTLITKQDGTVWAFGNNECGQLGDGTNVKSDKPVQVANLTNVVKISAGDRFSVAIKQDGTVWAWGLNDKGQLGNGTNEDSNIPVLVSLNTKGVTISAGYNHTLLVDENDIAWAWGGNESGQLGDKSYINKNIPVQISLTCVRSVSAGNAFSALVKNNNCLYTFGNNGNGQLGGERKYNNKPVQIADCVKDVSAGTNRIIAVKLDGTVYTCGFNYEGALGIYSSGIYVETLTQIPNLKDIDKVFAGGSSGFAITKTGKVLGWGDSTDIIREIGTAYKDNYRIRVLNIENIKDMSIFSGYSTDCVMIAEDGSLIDIYGKPIIINEKDYHPKNGFGTEDNPYLLVDVEDFSRIKNDKGAYYKLANDIDFGGKTIESIGTKNNPFTGNFDGNNFSLSNICITNNLNSIFGYTENAEIKNLNVIRVKFLGSGNIGALITSMNGGKLTDCGLFMIGQNVSQNADTTSAFVYSKSGGAITTGLDFGNLERLNGFEKTIDLKKDNTYEFVLTSEGGHYAKAVIYALTYDSSKVKIYSMATTSDTKSILGITVDSDMEIISNSNGVLKFKVNRTDKDWSGILANLQFTALSDGQTTIKFNAE